MSTSEPCSPSKVHEVDEKWFSTASCADLLGADADEKTSAVSAAQVSSLARKRRTIERFLEEHDGSFN